MAKAPKPKTEDQKAGTAAEAVTGPQTPATGNEGAAEAGEASAAAAPAGAADVAIPLGPLQLQAVTVEVISPIDHDGQHFEVGAPLTVPEDVFRVLKAAGAVN